MLAVNGWGVVVVACVLGGCSDGTACSDEKKLGDDIATHAKSDGISAQGLCALNQAEIATRLREGSVWNSASEADRDARAQQYVTNCAKVAQAKADCGD